MRTLTDIIIGKGYQILSDPEIGGVSLVYKTMDRNCALRAFKSPNLNRCRDREERLRLLADFENECEKLRSLRDASRSNPHIIRIHEIETTTLPYYIEMDYIEGMSFGEFATSRCMSLNEVYQFIIEIGEALSFCHYLTDAEGRHSSLIHNDLHPANIRYSKEDGRFYVIDFGLSMFKGDKVRSSKRSKGWSEFMPPERCRMELSGEGHDAAVPAWDIYSLGCLIFLALTGEAPFPIEENNDLQICQMHTEVDKHQPWMRMMNQRVSHFLKFHPDEPCVYDIPDWLEDMVMKCMALDPNDRYRDGREFMDEFRKNLEFAIVPYEDFAALGEENHKLRKRYAELNELYKSMELNTALFREEGRQVLGLVLMTAILVVMALAINGYAYWGGEEPRSGFVDLLSMLIMAITVLTVIGVTLYTYYVFKGRGR